MRIKIKPLFCAVLLLFQILLIGCGQNEECQILDMMDHADTLLFINTIGGNLLWPIMGVGTIRREGGGKDRLPNMIFVHSREEAEKLDEFAIEALPCPSGNWGDPERPAGTIIAWPSYETILQLEWINSKVVEHEIDLSEFYLTYPITVTDAVDRWENVYALLINFDSFVPRGRHWLEIRRWDMAGSREEQMYFLERWSSGTVPPRDRVRD